MMPEGISMTVENGQSRASVELTSLLETNETISPAYRLLEATFKELASLEMKNYGPQLYVDTEDAMGQKTIIGVTRNYPTDNKLHAGLFFEEGDSRSERNPIYTANGIENKFREKGIDDTQAGDIAFRIIDEMSMRYPKSERLKHLREQADQVIQQTLFGSLGREAYDKDARERIMRQFYGKGSKNEARQERRKMFDNYERLITRMHQELDSNPYADILDLERVVLGEINPLAKDELTIGREKNLGNHLREAKNFSVDLLITANGTSRFPNILTDRQAKILAYVIAPSHDLLKYLGKPIGEDFSADHQRLAAHFVKNVYQGRRVNLGNEVSLLNAQDVDFISQVVGDHENIFKEDNRQDIGNALHNLNDQSQQAAINRAKGLFLAIDTITEAVDPTTGVINTELIKRRFTDLYVRHMALDNGRSGRYGKIFRPEWGMSTVRDLINIFDTLQEQGLKIDRLPDGRSVSLVLVNGAQDAITKVMREHGQENGNGEVFSGRQLHAIDEARNALDELLGIKWLQREVLTLPGEKELEVVSTPNEVDVVPLTSDDKILLVKRSDPALGGEGIITVLSAGVNPPDATNNEIAIRAFQKITFDPLQNVQLEEVGQFASWKYLTSTSTVCVAQLLLSSDDIARKKSSVTAADEKTMDYLILSDEEFFAMIDDGRISDLRTINAVQLALTAKKAKERKLQTQTETTFEGDPEIVAKLGEAAIKGTRFIDQPTGQDWFPREKINGDEIIQNSSNQAQVLAVSGKGDQANFLFLIEPFFAQRFRGLTLPSGSKEGGMTGLETAVMEAIQETGYKVAIPQDQNPIKRYPMPLYLTVSSEVYVGNLVKKGSQEGGDESEAERGEGVEIPVSQVGWYIKNHYIRDASALAAIFDWGRKNGVDILGPWL